MRKGYFRRLFSQLQEFVARFLLVVCLCLLPLQLTASEMSLRLAFVYNFIKFIEWPHELPQIRLCVLGDQSGLQEALLPLNEKVFAGRKLSVVHIPLIQEKSALDQCQMLYLILPSLLADINQQLPQGQVLVTNEVTNPDPRVSFSLVRAKDNHIEFYVNTDALLHAKVTASSQLLKLAKNYQGGQ